ncbi:MAG: SpoVR family protein [Planctomycetaceae bacterium]|nr:SpoVR family protein [Planctomycetaceae bacterium]
MTVALPADLRRIRDRIRAWAEEFGLDFPETFFEVLDHDALHEVAAYGGFPTRYPHWRFGMQYEQLRKTYAYGLQKIYELVINNDPCYAYLMRSNGTTDQKIVMAHVYGHADFFKNNLWFGPTHRKMIDQMANHGTRVRRYADRWGAEKVERFLDDALCLENLVDAHEPYRPGAARKGAPDGGADDLDEEERRIGEKVPRLRAGPEYMDRYLNPPEELERARRRMERDLETRRRFPAKPERDVLRFLMENAPLSSWQRDLLAIVRAEALYFAPQAMTKIMNEGWATYWHSTIMTERALSDDELLDYADAHSSTLASSPGRLNPYKLGLELWRDIADRWDRGRFGTEYSRCTDWTQRRSWDTRTGLGRAKIFEVRKAYNDVTFIDEFLTEDFVREKRLFVYGRNAEGAKVIESRDFAKVKETLLRDLTNFGNPVVEVLDANHRNRGELLLRHRWEGLDLRGDYARDTMEALHRIWRRPVHVATKVEGRGRILVFDGTRHSSEEARGEEGGSRKGSVQDH